MSDETKTGCFSPGGDKYLGTVKLGPKGQIVIPKELRDMFKLAPGDNLLILGDEDRGIAIQPMGLMDGVFNYLFKNKPPTP